MCTRRRWGTLMSSHMQSAVEKIEDGAKSAFTPGPWRVRRSAAPVSGEFDYAITAVIDGRPVVIAECFGRAAENVRPDAKANATLYAAAPDLYAALKQLEVYAQVQVRRHSGSDDTQIWQSVLAALKKAGAL
jgi:hypothetical protein